VRQLGGSGRALLVQARTASGDWRLRRCLLGPLPCELRTPLDRRTLIWRSELEGLERRRTRYRGMLT
jgi:hypothetical protein